MVPGDVVASFPSMDILTEPSLYLHHPAILYGHLELNLGIAWNIQDDLVLKSFNIFA